MVGQKTANVTKRVGLGDLSPLCMVKTPSGAAILSIVRKYLHNRGYEDFVSDRENVMNIPTRISKDTRAREIAGRTM